MNKSEWKSQPDDSPLNIPNDSRETGKLDANVAMSPFKRSLEEGKMLLDE